MNKAMEWIKGHWLILSMMAVGLIALPVMLYFSSSMAESARTEVSTRIGNDWKELDRAAGVTYSVKPLLPTDPAIEKTFGAPNPRATEFFKALLEAQSAQAGEVVQRAVDFNKGKHGLLVAGLFPEPPVNNDRLLRTEFARRFTMEVHAPLLRSIGAGGPPDGATLAAELTAVQAEEVKRKTGLDKPDMNALGPAEKDEVARTVLSARVSRYQAHARNLKVYADVSLFRLPAFSESSLPSVLDQWLQQNEYWIHEDIIAAVGLANEGSTGVATSVVKRIESLAVDAFPGVSSSAGSAPGFGGGDRPPDPSGAPPAAANPGEAPTDFNRSVTGRYSGPGSNNGLYDVRTARLTVLVATNRLPVLFDSLARVNFMSVLDCDVEKIDPVAEMNAGFYYGDEHVSRVTLTIETIWLRAWTTKDMPKAVKAALGIPEAPPAPPPAG